MKRCSEESNVASKRQLIEIGHIHSPMSYMLAEAHSAWASMRTLLPSDLPATRDAVLQQFEPLLWKSSEVALKFGLALSIVAPELQLLAPVAESWEWLSVAIYRAKDRAALPLYPRTTESLAEAIDRVRRVAAVLDLYCKPLQNFEGTVLHFKHRGLVPALSAANTLINTLAKDLLAMFDVLAAGPYSPATFSTGPVKDLVTVTPRGKILFECVSCRCCPIYLPDNVLEDSCGYCQCPERFHSSTAPVFVLDLLLDEDDLQAAEEFALH